jgi:thiamine-phosphate pyrophosphorylase
MIRYAITDRSRLPPQNANAEAERRISLFALARQWAEQQIDYIQLREKNLSAAELEQIACAITAVIHGLKSGTKLLINSRADVALAAGAAGVHLTASPGQLTPAQVRTLFARAGRPAPVVSISCHTLDEVTRARNEQADLILFGPVFGKTIASSTRESLEVTPAAGLEALHAACEAAGEVPVLALGGVTEANTAACIAAGARGVAGIRLFTGDGAGNI